MFVNTASNVSNSFEKQLGLESPLLEVSEKGPH